MSSYSLNNGEVRQMPYLDSLWHPPQFSVQSELARWVTVPCWQSTAHIYLDMFMPLPDLHIASVNSQTTQTVHVHKHCQ